MKKIIVLALAAIVFGSCSNRNNSVLKNPEGGSVAPPRTSQVLVKDYADHEFSAAYAQGFETELDSLYKAQRKAGLTISSSFKTIDSAFGTASFSVVDAKDQLWVTVSEDATEWICYDKTDSSIRGYLLEGVSSKSQLNALKARFMRIAAEYKREIRG